MTHSYSFRKSQKNPFKALVVGLSLTVLGTGSAFAGEPSLDVASAGGQMSWFSDFGYEKADLRITGPFEYLYEARYEGEAPSFYADSLADGTYNWSLLLVSPMSDSVREALEKAREAGDEGAAMSRLKAAGEFEAYRLSGSFRVENGAVLVPGADGLVELGPQRQEARAVEKAQVFTTDLIVQGSECVGVDCSTSENFGSDTIRLKENNLRIHFDDTSSSGSFPKNDWRLIANDTNNGGASYFSIQDATANKTPFRVDAGADNNTLRVAADNRIGVGQGSPAVNVHVTEGNTPALRLEQDGSDGFQSQIWDLAGNETNFFLRDVTNSSKLPFRVKPGAPKNSLFIYADGDVGMGTGDTSADASLHVKGSDGDLQVKVEETSSTVADRTMFVMSNNGGSRMELVDTDTTSSTGGKTWFIQNDANSGGLNFSQDQSGGVEFKVNKRQDAGPGMVATMVVDGSVQATNVVYTSSRSKKAGFTAVDTADVLDRLAGIEIQTWHYKTQDASNTHMGPIAEDFAAAFGLGNSDKHISATDANGVALAAIQALNARILELQERLDELEGEVE